MIDVRRLHSTLVQLTGNAGVYVRINGELHEVSACSADRVSGAMVVRRLILDVDVAKAENDNPTLEIPEESDETVTPKRRGRPPKAVA
jgi:hypothetical protein